MKIGLAQLNPTVGDIDGNGIKILEIVQKYSNQCDIIVFPEMVLTGYPPQDLLFETQFISLVSSKINEIVNFVEVFNTDFGQNFDLKI